MATTISKLFSTGVLQTTVELDDVSISTSGGSAQFTGSSSNFLSVSANSAFTLGTNNHTIEFWMYQTSRGNFDCAFSYDGTAGQRAPNNYYLNVGNSQFYLNLGRVFGAQWAFNLNCGTLPSLNAWHHYAIVRIGNTFTVYVDGRSVASTSNITDSITAQGGSMTIGAYDTSGSSGCTGYITNFRFVNGVGVYTGNFVVPTTPFQTVQNSSASISAITGTDTKLLLKHIDSINLLTDSSSNNFTVTNNNSVQWSSLTPPFSRMQISTTSYRAVELDEINLGSGVAERRKADGTYQVSGYFDEYTLSPWIGSTTSTTTPSSNGTVTVGTTNGSPFSTTVNSYQIASQPTGSPYNYISVEGGSGFAFGTGDFTIEWFQKQTTSTSFARVFWYSSTAGATYPTIGVSLEGTAYFWTTPAAFSAIGNYGTILNTWVHFALVRISGKLYFYKNGTTISNAGITYTNNYTDTSSRFFIGSKSNGGSQSEQFIGSITNFRVCKGVGVYTGNFTVPTSPLAQTQGVNPYGGANTSSISAGQCTLLLNP